MVVSASFWFRLYIMVGADARIDIGFGFMRKLGFLSLNFCHVQLKETRACLQACDILED